MKGKRRRATGHIRQRGKQSYELKFVAENPATGDRGTQYVTVRGSKEDAHKRLRALLAAVDNNTFVEPSKTTLSAFVSDRIDQWEASGDISPRTAARYRELLNNQIKPHIGERLVQKLKPLDIEGWHTALRQTGLAARTIGHAHRVVGKALRDAERNEVIQRNVAKTIKAPKVTERQMIIATDIPSLVERLRGTRLQVPAMIALFTGMRLGEILALRWSRIDLDGRGFIQVVEAIEYTKAHGVRFKQPKSAAGRRNITLAAILIECLREYRRAQLELRMQLGVGRIPDEALLFTDFNGNPLSPNSVSSSWSHVAASAGIQDVTFHALRHTHASQLIDRGVDIVTISKRLGHADPSITLKVYAHLFRQDDGKASAAIDAAFATA
jgi:integrase